MSRFLVCHKTSGAEENGDGNVRALFREIVILPELDNVSFWGGGGHDGSDLVIPSIAM